MKNIFVIGAGLMGHGIAQLLAVNGCSVTLMDIKGEALAQAQEHIRTNLNFLADRGLGVFNDIEPALQRIRYTQDINEASQDADLIIETVLEKLDLKQKLFQELDRLSPLNTVLEQFLLQV